MRIPIAIKLVSLTILLLIGVTVPIALQSSKFFENVSRQREENVNLDYAAARATEVENTLNKLTDKIKSASLSLAILIKEGKVDNQEFDLSFNRFSDFLALEVLEIDGSTFKSLGKRVKKSLLEPFQLDENFITELRSKQQFPIRNVAQGTFEIMNGSLAKAPPLFTIGIPILKDPQGRITHIALADFQLTALQGLFNDQAERTFFLIDRKGNILAHSDEEIATLKKTFGQKEFAKLAQESVSLRGQKPFMDAEKKTRHFGAFAKTSFGVTVFSQISEEVILEPAVEVKRKAFYIAGLFLSGSILLIFMFSMSLTSPIETLAELIKGVAKGNFDVKASKKITSLFRDEVSELAIAFDKMTDGLKERDKVKSLFNKFHGSSVTDDLLKGNVGLGGQNRNVVVFFSDIRGFTAFSEKRSPEEVVAMLNEYFGLMVSVINKHQGVVDKFIGDAIMAVWGAPKSTPRDAHNALRACLEMRKALAELNAKRIARGQNPINIGMGLHAGAAISGTIGSDERMEYTVIGNTVNTGSRIEASTKAFGADLLISDTVLDAVGEEFLVEYAGAAEVKGRTEPIKLYKVRGYKDVHGKMVEIRTEYSDYTPEHADKVKVA
jgi:adenylate cyclase